MKPIWVIEDFDPDDSRHNLIEEVKNQGMECRVIKYIPFESGKYDDICSSLVIFQGSLNLGRQLKKEKNWVPGPWCNLENFKCSSYYPYFGQHLLNDDYFFIPVFELRRRKNELYEKIGEYDLLFIRPNSGFKTFTGKLVEKKHFEKDLEWMEEFSDRNSLAVVSSPKNVGVEYRFIICEKKIITGSLYKKDSGLNYEKLDLNNEHHLGALNYAQKICNIDWEPDPIYVLDVCESFGEFKLLEINSFSCSGLYECDLKIIVEKASELAIKEWRELYESD